MFSIFDFGANWEEFSKWRIDRQRLEMACESLKSLLEKKSLAGKEFSRCWFWERAFLLLRINSAQRSCRHRNQPALHSDFERESRSFGAEIVD